MTERNPYSINFGQIPDEFIRRMKSVNVILDSFLHDNPKQQVYMVSGVRGSGKTVFLTEIGHTIEKEKDWIGDC